MARPQKAQQQRRPVYSTQEKVQEYCEKLNAPPKHALLLVRGWITREMVITYVNCGECEGKRV